MSEHCHSKETISKMGTCYSRPQNDSVKRNKNHNRQKMFKIGVSFGRNGLTVEGHLQMGYDSKTIKNYICIETTNTLLPANEQVENDNVETREPSE